MGRKYMHVSSDKESLRRRSAQWSTIYSLRLARSGRSIWFRYGPMDAVIRRLDES
jgi:hypothetical protein